MQKLVFLLFLALASIAAHAAPVPGPSGYSYGGTPSFFQGALKFSDNGGFFTVIPGQGSLTQILLSNETVNTIVTTYNSFECIDSHTFKAEGSAIQLPSNEEQNWCGVIFFDGTTASIKTTDIDTSQSCPDSATTPPGPGEVLWTLAAISVAVVPSPSVTTCSSPGVPNFTGFPPPPPLSSPPPAQPPLVPAPPPPPKAKPGKVNLLPYAGSAQPQYGLWATQGVFMYHSQRSMYDLSFSFSILLTAKF